MACDDEFFTSCIHKEQVFLPIIKEPEILVSSRHHFRASYTLKLIHKAIALGNIHY